MSTQLLGGHIQTFYVKHQGRRLGPYYARVWKQNGRRRRQYIPAHRLEETIAACQSYRERRKRQIEKRKELERILTNLNFLRRMAGHAKRIEHLLLHEQEHVRRIQTQGIAAPGRPDVRRRRGFMGPLLRMQRQKHPRPLPECMAKRLREAPIPEPQPETENLKPKTRRYWRLPHELPAWLTEELWQEMASRIPQNPKEPIK